MSRQQKTTRLRHKQQGQVAAEYIVGCVVVLVLLGVLNLGFGADDKSIIEIFLEQVDKSYDRLSTFLSIPL